ncbi:MAG: KpsF/GutQ family sugar-phosphate isomerase [Verrucomicrobiota bacterium]
MPDHLSKARTVIQIEREALSALENRLGPEFEAATESLLTALKNDRKIVLVGIGKSGNIAHKIAATLTSTGSPAVVLHSQNALHGDLGLLSEGDAVLALSYSGETSELINLLPFLKRRASTLIALTGKPHSTLAQHADHTLDTSVPREACPLQLAPTSSSTTMLVLGDALAMVLLEAQDFTAENFADYHPGGTLGRALLTAVRDIMRTGDRLALVPPDTTVFDSLTAMSKAKSGAALIQNPDQTLAGIFTHGDFARSFQADPSIGTQPIANFMTPSPITIPPDALAAEAVKLIAERNIDDLIVLDPSNRIPLGLIDSQDLARLGLV